MACDAFAVALCPILIKCGLVLVRFASEWGSGKPNPSALASAAVDPARHERTPSRRRFRRPRPTRDAPGAPSRLGELGCSLTTTEQTRGWTLRSSESVRAVSPLWNGSWARPGHLVIGDCDRPPGRPLLAGTGPGLAHQPVTGAAHEHRGLQGDRVHGAHRGHGRAG